MDKKLLFQLLSGPPQSDPALAPLPTGNLGAGASSPLGMGPMVADNAPIPAGAIQALNGRKDVKTPFQIKHGNKPKPSLFDLIMGKK